VIRGTRGILTVHHGALAYQLAINALRASEAAGVRIEDYADMLRGHRVLHLVGKGAKPATMPLTVPVLRTLEACRGERTAGPLVLRPVSGKPIDRRDVFRMVLRIAKVARVPATSAHTPCATPPSSTPSTPASRCGTHRSSPETPTPAPPALGPGPRQPPHSLRVRSGTVTGSPAERSDDS
jgi:hypothetical protein